LKEKMKGPIICFIGPPGVGKTSLGKSIARALGREFVRMSLGGVRTRQKYGARRTYVGALPAELSRGLRQQGRITLFSCSMKSTRSGWTSGATRHQPFLKFLTRAELFLADHYLAVPFDLSKVMFITTGNLADTIPGPLRDRMEVIYLSGYTTEEKRGIAKNYLIPKQLEEHGISSKVLKITDPGF